MDRPLPGLREHRPRGRLRGCGHLFQRIFSEVEEQHEKRYLKLLDNVRNGRVFKREAATTRWHCRNRGYVHEGPEAPEVCPACKHPQAYYELWAETY